MDSEKKSIEQFIRRFIHCKARRAEAPCFTLMPLELQQLYEKNCSFHDWDWTLSWCFFMIWLYHLGTLFNFISVLHPISTLQLHGFRIKVQLSAHQQLHSRCPRHNSPNHYLNSLWPALEQTNVTLLFYSQQFKQNKENYIHVRLPTRVSLKKV